MEWLRLYTEIKDDRKLRRHNPSVRWAWIVILCVARESPSPGELLISDGLPITIDDLADMAAIPVKDVKKALAIFVEQGMLELVDGTYKLLNWDKRQFESDKGYERVKRHRERKKAASETNQKQERNVSMPLQETNQKQERNVFETPPDTDTDTDTEYSTTTTTNTNVSVGVDGSCCLDKIVNLYQGNISPLTGILAESLMADREQYGDAWVEQAIIMAVKQNKRKPAYVNGILQNWWRNGFKQDDKPWEVRGKPRGGMVADGKPKGEPPLKAFYRKFMDEESKEVQGSGQRV